MYFTKGNQTEILTDKALKTNGSPDILLLAMLKCVNRLPTVVTKSDRHVLETALRELQDDGCRKKKSYFIKQTLNECQNLQRGLISSFWTIARFLTGGPWERVPGSQK